MQPIRIVLAQSRSDLLARLLAEAIRQAAEFELVHPGVASVEALRRALPGEAEGVDVLIVVGEVGEDVLDAFRQRHPAVIVSLIGIGSETVRLDVRLLEVEDLLAALRFHAREEGPPGYALRYEVVGLPGSGPQASRLVPVQPARSPLLRDVFAWLDAALLAQHARMAPGASGHGGLSRPADAILHLLSRSGLGQAGEAAEEASASARLRESLRAAPDEEPLARCQRSLALTETEVKILLLALAPELDPAYQLAFGMLADYAGLRCPTFGLACAIIGDQPEIRGDLNRSRNLTRWRLIETGALWPRAEDPLRLDDAIVAWMLGDARALTADRRLAGATRAETWRGVELLGQPEDVAATRQLGALLEALADGEWLVLSAPDCGSWRAQLEQVARRQGRRLLRVEAAPLATLSPGDFADAVGRLARAARLQNLVFVLDAAALPESRDAGACLDKVAAVLRHLPLPAVVVASDAEACARVLAEEVATVLQAEPRSPTSLAGLYRLAAEEEGLALTPDACEALATAHPLALAEIEEAVRLAAMRGAGAEPAAQQARLVAAACRRISSPGLPRFATRVTPIHALTEVVLPPDGSAQLAELVNQVRRVPQVMNGWGFGAQVPFGRSVSALFAGSSGTGKSMAALAIARELGTEAFLVDLSRLVSKFIGESEKNLDTVFGDAERAGAVLVFNEADALFGKRSEIKDAHDRYANMEVAYLLQRMESFSGLVILTTNFRQNLDQAFLRRLRFLIDFPKPDMAARQRIWRQCLPPEAPLADDVDLAVLARRIDVAGGNIRQITLRAAFAAAGEGRGAIGMDHLLAAARAELVKLGRSKAAEELEAWQAFLRQSGRRAA